MKSILFICTGNVFRSVVAEYALKAWLGSEAGYVIGSAGIEAFPQALHTLICDRLREKGADASRHVQRQLTRALFDSTDLPVAMGLDHRDFIRRQFDRDVLLFDQICYEKEEPVLDVHEALPDWHLDPERGLEYAVSVLEYIWNAMPAFVARIPRL